jgi:hypothetical protein
MAGARTRLERLAESIPLPPDELRDLLRREIAKALRARAAEAPVTPTMRLVCEECGAGYLVTESRAIVVARSGKRRVCPACRVPRLGGEPGAHEHRWVEALPAQDFARAMAAVAELR